MDMQKEFGHRVRELRMRQGLTQEQLASRCGGGFPMQRIGAIERGETNCTLKTIEAIQSGLGCDPSALFLFAPAKVGQDMAQLDRRLLDFWKNADDKLKAKALRILSELA
jgi:transcriptional regulator with XRE-family HTH domain